MSERTITTEDGKTVREGDRVFNYYDGWWGTLGPIDEGGWADVHGADRRAYLNGQRISTYDPKGSLDPQSAAARMAGRLRLDIPADRWEPKGDTDDPTAALTGPMLEINGLMMHVEAWAVDTGEEMQDPAPAISEEYDLLHAAVHADGSFQTLTINDRDYIVVITPHC